MQRLLEPGFGVRIEREDGAEVDWRVTEVANDGMVLVGSAVTPMPGERVRIAWGSSRGAFTGTTRVLEAEIRAKRAWSSCTPGSSSRIRTT